jgi:orotate phosphoribosyltransferase
MADATVVTTVPTGAPLVSVAFDRAAPYGWFHFTPREIGFKRDAWNQHDKHLPRTPADWIVDSSVTSGRRVLLLDDFFVTGQSLFSYAAARRGAGAVAVTAVVLVRIVKIDYYTVLARLRREHDLTWQPSRAYPAAPAEAM